MTHRKPVAYRSPVFRIRGATPPLFSSVDHSPARSPACHSPDRSATTAAAPPDLRPPRGLPARSPPAAAAPPDLRPPRGLPARSPPAPRASLGASARSPARPRRPRIGLRSGGSWRAFPLPSQALAPHATQNSPSTRTTPVSQPYFRAVASTALSAQRSTWESPACYVPAPDRAPNPELSPQ